MNYEQYLQFSMTPVSLSKFEMIKKYIDRLLDEWKQHGKIIIACDFDDTISPWKFHNEDFSKVFDLLKKCKDTGAYIVIWSACNADRFPHITEYCKTNGLEIDGINTNPLDLPYGKDKKIYANIYLDDRAGLTESLEILETCLYAYRGYLQTQKTTTDVA